MKYGIALYSRYTGEKVAVLGSRFDTIEDMEAYADKEVCPKCNRVEMVYIPDGWMWKNRHEGFVSMERLKDNTTATPRRRPC